MIQGSNFDFKSIILKSEKVNKKIDFNSNNVKNLKKVMFSLLYVGGLSIACIIGIVLYYDLMVGKIDFKTSLIIFISTIIFGTIFCSLVLSNMMEVFSYYKLKKISKKNDYEVYKYTGDIQAIYTSTYIEKRMSLDDDLTSGVGYEKTNGIILMIENQKIYLLKDVYQRIIFDKKITLYFAKRNNLCVLYNYERILNENSILSYVKPKNNTPVLVIVALIMFGIMILILPILSKLGFI